jgi:lysozyme family protein
MRERPLWGFVIIVGVLLMSDIIDLVVNDDKLSFEIAKANNINQIKIHEGSYKDSGYVNDPDDLGGETKFGVSTKFLNKLHENGSWLQYSSVNDIPHADAATEIFEKEFFANNRTNYGRTLVTLKMDDIAVNVGGREATRIMQRALNSLYEGDSLMVDGKTGPNSNTSRLFKIAFEEHGETRVLHALANEQANFYRSLVAQDPSQGKFLEGWLTRAAYKPKY